MDRAPKLPPTRLIAFCLVTGLLSACGSGSSPAPSVCHYNSDCPAALTCVANRCMKECETDRDCPASATCIEGTCSGASSMSEAGSSGATSTSSSSEAGAAGAETTGTLAAPQTAAADYLDKNDLTPVEFGLLAGGTAPADLPSSSFASEPSFYMQSTLLTQPQSTGFLGIPAHSRTDEIRWQISEDRLVARRASELVTGSTWSKPLQGDPIAEFAVTLHFDVQRVTDAETGTISYAEDTTSHPWYARRYLRVDWSQNLVGDALTADFDFGIGHVSGTAVPLVIASPADTNAPFFDYSALPGAQKELSYLDVVNQVELHPESASLGTSPDLPVCALGDGDGPCGPSLVTWRTGFRRADPTRDYQAVGLARAPAITEKGVPTGANFGRLDIGRFGVRDTASVGPLGSTGPSAPVNAVRHNLWFFSHARVAGTVTSTLCNLDADCQAGLICQPQATAPDASHPGACAPPGFDHKSSDLACSSDADCAPFGSAALSGTAGCDSVTKTCGERFVRCAADSDCAALSAASTCDTIAATARPDASGLCTLPFAERQVRPLAYFESADFPDSLQPAAEQALSEWNAALSASVVAMRQRECEIATSIDPSATPPASDPCTASSVTGAQSDAQFVLVGCHNPVWGTASGPGQQAAADVDAAHALGWDLDACGPQGTTARAGDLRHHLLEAITDRSDAQDSWGLSNVAADPTSGEILAGHATVWKTVTDAYAAEVVSLARLYHGVLDPAAPLPVTGVLPVGFDTSSDGSASPGGLSAALTSAILGSTEASVVGDGSNGSQRFAALLGSALEKTLVNTDQARLNPAATPDDTASLAQTLDLTSPLRGQSPAAQRTLERLRRTLGAEECRMLPGFSPDNILYLASFTAKWTGIPPHEFGQDWSFKTSTGDLDETAIQNYAELSIARVVFDHELGHSLGLRHNFAGSADALNYDDTYWRVRGQGHPGGLLPRFQYVTDVRDFSYYSPQENAGRVETHSYSSVMDERDVGQVSNGLGRYDVAALKSLYGGLVQAFKSVADNAEALMYSFNTAGHGLTTAIDAGQYPKISGMHYTQIPMIYGFTSSGVPNIGDDNRYDVFQVETQATPLPGWGPPVFSNITADGHALVPYRYGGDAASGLDWTEMRGDVGADVSESVNSLATLALGGYLADSFAHSTGSLSATKYVSHLRNHLLDPIRQEALTAALDLISSHFDFGADPSWNTFSENAAGLTNQAALAMAGNTLGQLLAIPEDGGYAPTAQFDGSSLLTASLGASATPVNLALGDGRSLSSVWGSSTQLPWYAQLERAGSYYDKTVALQTLTDRELPVSPNSLFTQGPASVELGFSDIWPGQFLRFMGGVLARDAADSFDLVQISGSFSTLLLPNLAAAPSAVRGPNSEEEFIDPNLPLSVAAWAAVLSSATVDAPYRDFFKLTTDGEANALSGATTPTVSFIDPSTGDTYRALHFSSTSQSEHSSVRHPTFTQRRATSPPKAGSLRACCSGYKISRHCASEL